MALIAIRCYIWDFISCALCDKWSFHMSRVERKLVFGDSDQVRHGCGCTVKEDGERLEISD